MKLTIDKTRWKNVKLGDVAFEYARRVNDPSGSGFERFVGSSNINQWDFRIKSWESTDSVTSTMKLFERNDYLLVRRSLYASDFRERAPRANFDGVCSGDILTIKENSELIADGFLIGILNSPDLWKYVVANGSGSITRRIKWRDLANYEFLLPPKDQQARLAELLWAIEEISSSANVLKLKNLELLNTLRESLFFNNNRSKKLIYNDRLKRQVSSHVDFIPLGALLTDIRYGTSVKSNSNRIGVPVLGIPNIVIGKLHTDEISHVELPQPELKNTLLSKGDILIVRTNGNPDYTGRSAIFNLESDFTFASYLIKITIQESKCRPDFISRYLQTNTVRRYFRRNATSTAGNFNINTETIKNLPVPVTDKRSQEAFVEELIQVEELYEDATLNEKNVAQLQKSLINQIF